MNTLSTPVPAKVTQRFLSPFGMGDGSVEIEILAVDDERYGMSFDRMALIVDKFGQLHMMPLEKLHR